MEESNNTPIETQEENAKLATVEKIVRVYPHPNSDKLELAQVLGYQCAFPNGQYQPNDLIVFVKPDNVLPLDEWAEPYRKYAKKRIRVIKLRGEWSEGLIIDLSVVAELTGNASEGDDVSQALGITHYEAPVGYSNGNVKGRLGLPYGIPMTDEYRFENIKPEKREPYYGELVDVSLKIDGQSWSAFYRVAGAQVEHEHSSMFNHLEKSQFGLLGRRMTLDTDVENNYTVHLKKYDIENKLKEYCQKHQVSLCIRGESYGKGIGITPNNPHCKLANDIAIFSVFMIDKNRYAGKGEEFYFVNVCKELGLPTVPIIETDVPVTHELIVKYALNLNRIDGKPFEGVVMKGKNFSFKVINKEYDSKK